MTASLCCQCCTQEWHCPFSCVFSWCDRAPTLLQPNLNTAGMEHWQISEQPVSHTPPVVHSTTSLQGRWRQKPPGALQHELSSAVLSSGGTKLWCSVANISPVKFPSQHHLLLKTHILFLLTSFYFHTMQVSEWKLPHVLLKTNLVSDFGVLIYSTYFTVCLSEDTGKQRNLWPTYTNNYMCSTTQIWADTGLFFFSKKILDQN